MKFIIRHAVTYSGEFLPHQTHFGYLKGVHPTETTRDKAKAMQFDNEQAAADKASWVFAKSRKNVTIVPVS